MRRNVILALSSLGVLVVLFGAYVLLVGTPAAQVRSEPPVGQLPPQAGRTGEPLRIGQDIELPAGGQIIFRVFDEHTGQPTDLFSCQDWQPVPGSKNEMRVTQPELAMLLPSGMIATVLADEGQMTADRIERSQMKPRRGWLTGHVRIIIDRETNPERTPRAERPQDLITIHVERLDFDLERGELRTDDRVQVESDEFEIAGSGLDLVWNQADNRVETLTIARGEEFVFFAPAGLFGAVEATRQEETGPAATTQASSQKKPPFKKGDRRPATAYACTLTGGVVAEQYREDQHIGGLQADEVRLLFDVGSGAGRMLRPTATSPTSRPARESGHRLVVRWNGKLQLGPADGPADAEGRRMHFVAVGEPVVMTRGDGAVRCAKVEYHDETQRIWLNPLPGEPVDFTLGKSLSASAAGVYVDRTQRLVKLAGEVELRSRRGADTAERTETIRAADWGELHLAEDTSATPPALDAPINFQQIESATFVGDVRVGLGEQALTAQRLTVGFRPGSGEETLEQLLDTATATGQVHMTGGDGAIDAERLDLAFDRTSAGKLYPRQMHAWGAAQLTRRKAWVRGDEVNADLAPASEDQQARGRDFLVRTIDVQGRAELRDPEHRRAARGQRIVGTFEDLDRFKTGMVTGTTEEPGVVHSWPYTIRGGRIDLDYDALTLHADGPSRLSFKARRSLQGQERRDATPIVVTSDRMMHVDGRANTVSFAGDVTASSGEEQLQGDTLTLYLEDVPEPEQPPPPPSWRDLWRLAQRLAGGQEAQPKRADALALPGGQPAERLRKEPARLTADNALVTSESFERGDRAPAVHASISSPRLEVDVARRQIVTTGLTQLLMTDLRGVQEVEPARETLGLPSALMSRGPSQTAMQCQKRMTYTLGPEGPNRRDTVVFEEDVVFVHRTGKEMVDLQQILPQAAANPALLETLKSRNATLDCDRLECWFAVDETKKRPERGGALTRTPMRLVSLHASGSAYLRDQQGPRIREVNAASVEFDREQGRLYVRGTERAIARVYFEDTERSLSDVHTGRELAINLQDGTIRSGEMVGQMRRP